MKDIYGKLREEHVQLLRTVSSVVFCSYCVLLSCLTDSFPDELIKPIVLLAGLRASQ